MTGSIALVNRRREPRQSLSRSPVAWSRHGITMWRRGWMNDISASGVSLLVSTEGLPHVGQEIDLRLRYGQEALLCRVVRTQVREKGKGMVACRVVSANGCPALLQPAPNARTARGQASGGAWPPGLWIRGPLDAVLRKSTAPHEGA